MKLFEYDIHDYKYELPGIAMEFLYKVNPYGTVEIAYIEDIIYTSARVRNIIIFKDLNDQPVVLFIWGYFTNEIHMHLSRGYQIKPDVNDWNEGENLWVYEMLSLSYCPIAIIRALSEKFKGKKINFHHNKTNYYLRNGKIVKCLS